MRTEGHDDVIFMVGPEIQHTSAFSLKTLFVQGVRSVSQTIEYAEEHKVKAIYLGLNGSFQRNKKWNGIIEELLQTGLKVSFEYPVDAHDFVLEILDSAVVGHPNFIPVVNCKLNRAETTNGNLSLLIDCDGETNDGSWAMPVSELLDSNRFVSRGELEHMRVLLRDEKAKVVKKAAAPKKKATKKETVE